MDTKFIEKFSNIFLHKDFETHLNKVFDFKRNLFLLDTEFIKKDIEKSRGIGIGNHHIFTHDNITSILNSIESLKKTYNKFVQESLDITIIQDLKKFADNTMSIAKTKETHQEIYDTLEKNINKKQEHNIVEEITTKKEEKAREEEVERAAAVEAVDKAATRKATMAARTAKKKKLDLQKKASQYQQDLYEKLKKRHILCYNDINKITIIDIYDCLPIMIKDFINNETKLPADKLGENVNEIKTLIYIILCYFNTLLSDTCSQDILNIGNNSKKDKYTYPDDTCSGYFFNVLIKETSEDIRKEFLEGYTKTIKDIHNLSVFSDSLKVLRHVSKLSLVKKDSYDTYKVNIINNIKKIFNPIPAAKQGSEGSQEKNISIKFDETLLDIIYYYSIKYEKYNDLNKYLNVPSGYIIKGLRDNIKGLTDNIINILNYLFDNKYLIKLSNEENIISKKLEYLYKLINTQYGKTQKFADFNRLIDENINTNLKNIMEKITKEKNHIYFHLFEKINTKYIDKKKEYNSNVDKLKQRGPNDGSFMASSRLEDDIVDGMESPLISSPPPSPPPQQQQQVTAPPTINSPPPLAPPPLAPPVLAPPPIAPPPLAPPPLAPPPLAPPPLAPPPPAIPPPKPPAKPPPPPAATATDGHSALLSEIQMGKKLKKVDITSKPDKPGTSTSDASKPGASNDNSLTFQQQLAASILARGKAMNPEDEDGDEGGDDKWGGGKKTRKNNKYKNKFSRKRFNKKYNKLSKKRKYKSIKKIHKKIKTKNLIKSKTKTKNFVKSKKRKINKKTKTQKLQRKKHLSRKKH